jgi:hypothetical protein
MWIEPEAGSEVKSLQFAKLDLPYEFMADR